MTHTPETITTAMKAYLARTGGQQLDIQYALIDMDGTLYDSMGNHATAWKQLMTELNVPCERDEFFMYEGMTGAAIINLLFRRTFGKEVSAEEAAELYHRKTINFQKLPKVSPMQGARTMLEKLAEAAVGRVLVTGSGQATLLNRLETDFPGAFTADKMITSHNVAHGKPSPEPYLKALEIAGVRPNQAIVIENAPLGVKSGVDAGVFTVAVMTGPIPRQMFVDAGADIIFDSMPNFSDNVNVLLETAKNNL